MSLSDYVKKVKNFMFDDPDNWHGYTDLLEKQQMTAREVMNQQLEQLEKDSRYNSIYSMHNVKNEWSLINIYYDHIKNGNIHEYRNKRNGNYKKEFFPRDTSTLNYCDAGFCPPTGLTQMPIEQPPLQCAPRSEDKIRKLFWARKSKLLDRYKTDEQRQINS